MSTNAQISDIVNISDPESPQQNNGIMDESNTSIQLPDLVDVLAALNERKQTSDDHIAACSTEIRAFGASITRYSHLQQDGTVIQPLVTVKRKPRLSKGLKNDVCKKGKESMRRVTKKAASKTPAKKPLTITERAVAPFLQSIEPTKANDSSDRSILSFLTPGRIVPEAKTRASDVAQHGAVPRKRKPRTKVEPLPPLSTPRTARKKHSLQTLVHAAGEIVVDGEDSHHLNPSRLVGLSRGLFQQGNRGLLNELTDGGPSECVSNQEALRQSAEDELLDLTMLPSRRLENQMEDEHQSEAISCGDGHSEAHSPGNLDDPEDLQDYLRELVDLSDNDASDVEFPVTPTCIPVNLRSDTVESLRSLLDSEKDTADAVEGSAGRTKRARSFNQSPRRHVSPKFRDQTCPEISDDVVIIKSSAGLPNAENVLEVENLMDLSHIEKQPKPDLSQRRAGPVAEEAECIEEFTDTPSVMQTAQTRAPHDSKQSHILTNSRLPLFFKDHRVSESAQYKERQEIRGYTTQSKTKSDEDYWLVPDSEDESVDLTVSADPPDAQNEGLRRPDFTGYTTARLQAEISRFGFKLSKNRVGMIELLNKCWEAKNDAEKQRLNTKSASKPPAAQFVVQDGPRESINDECINLVDTDSNQPGRAAEVVTAMATSVKARKPRETASEKADRLVLERQVKDDAKRLKAAEKVALKLATAERKKAEKLANKEATKILQLQNMETLYADLTRLLRDSGQQNMWWNKILTYEPVVLEDMVEWLAEQHSIDIDSDDLRDYFDGKGVCCVKRVTRQGKGRRRF